MPLCYRSATAQVASRGPAGEIVTVGVCSDHLGAADRGAVTWAGLVTLGALVVVAWVAITAALWLGASDTTALAVSVICTALIVAVVLVWRDRWFVRPKRPTRRT
jgi:hypothetical protein